MQNVLLERVINQKKGVDVEMGGCNFFIIYGSIKFTVCVYVGGSKVPFITFWILSLLSYPFTIFIQVLIVLKPGVICTFLIDSGSLQKMLTALFNLV